MYFTLLIRKTSQEKKILNLNWHSWTAGTTSATFWWIPAPLGSRVKKKFKNQVIREKIFAVSNRDWGSLRSSSQIEHTVWGNDAPLFLFGCCLVQQDNNVQNQINKRKTNQFWQRISLYCASALFAPCTLCFTRSRARNILDCWNKTDVEILSKSEAVCLWVTHMVILQRDSEKKPKTNGGHCIVITLLMVSHPGQCCPTQLLLIRLS